MASPFGPLGLPELSDRERGGATCLTKVDFIIRGSVQETGVTLSILSRKRFYFPRRIDFFFSYTIVEK